MIVHNFDPVSIDFGILQIRWYSLAYIIGILAGWWYGKVIIKKQILDSDQNNYLKNFPNKTLDYRKKHNPVFLQE